MLVERDTQLATLTDLVDAAVAGRGHVALLGGEAGIGKSSLAAAVVEHAAGRATVRRGGCDDLTTAAALGPLLEAVPELVGLTDTGAAVDRVQLTRLLRQLMSAEPSVLVLEDIHWADEATLDAVRSLARRVADLPLLVLATYRTEAAASRHPLTRLLGALATSPAVRRMELPPLRPEGVAALVAAVGSTLDPTTLHAETGGNPFYVTEVLATGSPDSLPSSVRDAVLARTGNLSAAARRALAAAAVLGGRPSLQVLVEVAGCTDHAVDECIDNGILVARPDGCGFRHALARRAVESTLAPGERAQLHRRALATLRAVGDDRRLAHHATGCGDHAAVLVHATRAGEHAARLGAHREAVEQFRAALRSGAPDEAERGRLLQALSYECYLTDQLEEALAARLQVLDLAVVAGDARAVGATLRWLSRLSWYLGRNAESERYARRAVETLEPLGPCAELAMAVSNQAQLRMLDGDTAVAIEVGRRALAIAREVGDRDTEIHALNNIGTAQSMSGELVEGRQLLMRSLDLALVADAHEHAARAYTNLGSNAVLMRELIDGERHLRGGIAYCTERDLDSWRLYMSGWLARLHAERGELEAAATISADVLASPALSPITFIVAATAAAQVAARRGDPAAARLLDEALALAERTGEAQRLVPVAAARAEAAWLAGDLAAIPAEIDRAWDAAAAEGIGWNLGELAWWLFVAGQPRRSPVRLPVPFALMADAAWSDAAEAWQAVGAPLWAAAALAQRPELAWGRAAIERAEAVGAPAWARAIRRDRVRARLPVPRAPRRAHRELPHQLTARELEVLQLLADGLSNAEVGSRLFVSEKTVGHHVSAVLRKLGEPTRSRAVAAARREGIVGQT